jgi:AraC-like DNA-binding protein
VLPDTCVDIVVINHESPLVVGPWTEPFVARLAPGTTVVGARCHPGLAQALIGLPVSTMLNQSVPLDAIWGKAARTRFERIADLRGLATRRSAMEAALLDHMARATPGDETTRAALQWLARHPHGRTEELSRWIGFSSRQLRRRFTAAVGYGPKMFQSVLRFQRLLNLTSGRNAPQNLARLSADAGYSDQAHMTREVRRFSGSPPTALLPGSRSALQLSDLLQATPGDGG